MAKIIHKFYNQNDSLLLPPSLGELILPAHPVRVVNSILDRLDISTLLASATATARPTPMPPL